MASLNVRKRFGRIIPILLVFFGILSISGFAVMGSLSLLTKQAEEIIDLSLYYRVRFEILGQSPKGMHYIQLFDTYTGEITHALSSNPILVYDSVSALGLWNSNLDALVNGNGDKVVITQEQVEAVVGYLDLLSRSSSAELQSVIAEELTATPLEATVGMTMNQAWIYLNQDTRFPPSADNGQVISVSMPETISANLVHWSLPENPAFSIDFDPAAWELLSWNNGIAFSWELKHRSQLGCVVTIPETISDPYVPLKIDFATFGEVYYQSGTSVFSDLTLYVLYKPLNIPSATIGNGFQQKELVFVVYPGYSDPEECIRQSGDLFAGFHSSSNPH
ncbi:MAG: hypothetical protein ACOYZ8_16225 [Chloroflexota bacterium]